MNSRLFTTSYYNIGKVDNTKFFQKYSEKSANVFFFTSFRFCAILGNIASDILDNPFANFYPSMHYKLNDSDGLSSGECHL